MAFPQICSARLASLVWSAPRRRTSYRCDGRPIGHHEMATDTAAASERSLASTLHQPERKSLDSRLITGFAHAVELNHGVVLKSILQLINNNGRYQQNRKQSIAGKKVLVVVFYPDVILQGFLEW
uniref:Uncharacterized protein n=1 Tax=Leersia perrieri TaxID=77586 RepID=A0A0D9W669_9ORYZ